MQHKIHLVDIIQKVHNHNSQKNLNKNSIQLHQIKIYFLNNRI